MIKKFVWGKVLDRFDFDFDGEKLEVVKFHPWQTEGATVRSGIPDESVVHFHCEQIRESFLAMDALLIAWIAHRRLGLNQGALTAGICRALAIYKD